MLGNVRYPIAISGKASSGKNTVAEMFVSALGLSVSNTKIVALADPMKYIAQIMFPMAKHECLYGPSELRSNIIDPEYIDSNGKQLTYRQFLLDLGKLGRSYNTNTWLNCLINDSKKSVCEAYIVSDVRMCNELELLQKNMFITIRVSRNGSARIDDISETEQDTIPAKVFDYTIDNNSTKENLYAKVSDIANELKIRKFPRKQ